MEEKKSKCPKKNSKCEEGEKCKCRISGVRKKKWKKSSEKKNQSVLGGNFAKFVFTGLVLY